MLGSAFDCVSDACFVVSVFIHHGGLLVLFEVL